jgi:hypothetical protein
LFLVYIHDAYDLSTVNLLFNRLHMMARNPATTDEGDLQPWHDFSPLDTRPMLSVTPFIVSGFLRSCA